MQAFWEWFVSQDGGIVATWVGGIGTTAAVVMALIQAQYETRMRRKDEERAQAVKVYAWQEHRDGHRPICCVTNESSQPIYEVYALCSAKSALQANFENTRWVLIATDMVLPEETRTCRLDNSSDFSLTAGRPVKVSFRDSSGKVWVRERDGQLKNKASNSSKYLPIFEGLGNVNINGIENRGFDS